MQVFQKKHAVLCGIEVLSPLIGALSGFSPSGSCCGMAPLAPKGDLSNGGSQNGYRAWLCVCFLGD
jgi:hypothetical protein